MKSFLAGVIIGVLGSTLALRAQHSAEPKVVQPQLVLENQRIKVERWVLQPGESSPVHAHALDHVGVTLHGSTLRMVGTDGSVKESLDKDGFVDFGAATAQTHSFINVGKTTFEAVSIDLK
jgi:predicted metal-dependent enzyme (double-stranded beta helix superfamily)